jgi:type IV pilus secretin PilQ/predicted competence protein
MNQRHPAWRSLAPGVVLGAQILLHSAAMATVVKNVDLEDRNGATQVTVEADGPVRYEDFMLSNPDRLVIDCLDATSLLPPKLDSRGLAGRVRAVTTTQWNGQRGQSVARIVCELSARSSYSIAARPTGLVVVIEGGKPAANGLGYDEDRLASAAPEAAVPVEASAPPAPAPPVLVIEPQTPAPRFATRAFGSPDDGGASERLEARPDYLGQSAARRVSLDVQRASILTVLRTLAQLSGRNIVSNQGVTGEVTVRLTDVPWPQALDIVLLTQGLGFTDEEGVLRIAQLDRLRQEEAERQTAARKQEELQAIETRVLAVNFAKAEELKPAVDKLFTARGHAEVDTRTNSLVVTDIAERVAMAQSLVGQLDTRTPQVEIDSRLVDLDVSDSRDLGIDWTAAVTPAGAGDLGRQQSFTSKNPIAAAAGELRVGAIRSKATVDAVLQALAESRKANIISNPRITTVNNRAASILVGQEIPLIVQDQAFNTVVQLKQIGIKLTVRPHINSDRQIELDVHPEVSDLAQQSTVQGGIIINTSEADTRVLVKDGQTAVIGGLVRENESTRVRGIPILKDIPALSWLFSSSSKVKQKRELLIFITPRIVGI